ncbi:MAG: TetR/AcrR family transcriptional regulator [Chloroflexota bacterium]|nr:MAG: TetR/AcrR family transcriptional regulator [Chloroflexota bacterium]
MTVEQASGTLVLPISAASKKKQRGAKGPKLAEARTDRILATAVGLFGAGGYQTTTMDEIAEATELNKATVYRYFSSKEDILYALYQRFLDAAVVQTTAIAEGPGTASEKLRAHLKCSFTMLRDYLPYWHVVIKEDSHLSDRRLAVIRRKRKAYAAAVDRIIQEGIAAGEFRTLDPRIIKLAVEGMCNWGFRWFKPGGPMTAEALAEAFAEIALNGIVASPDARSEGDQGSPVATGSSHS